MSSGVAKRAMFIAGGLAVECMRKRTFGARSVGEVVRVRVKSVGCAMVVMMCRRRVRVQRDERGDRLADVIHVKRWWYFVMRAFGKHEGIELALNPETVFFR